MASFKEFLEDYERKEDELMAHFIDKLEKGKVSNDEIYPPKDRFIKLKMPIAASPIMSPLWTTVPFYGSTMISLIPRRDRKEFDEAYTRLRWGFTSKNIDEITDIIKETGRIQFNLRYPATYYKGLDFLENIFYELKPPSIPNLIRSIITMENYNKYGEEFKALSSLGYAELIYMGDLGGFGYDFWEQEMENYSAIYAGLKSMGYELFTERIGDLMVDNPYLAKNWLSVLGLLVTSPQFTPLKEIRNYDKDSLYRFKEIVGDNFTTGLDANLDIGKFILEKLVRYPDTKEGCWEIMQYYDDEDLYKVLNSLNEGIHKENIDIVMSNIEAMNEVLDNVWNETDKIDKIKKYTTGTTLSLGLIGTLSGLYAGSGILSTLGIGSTIAGSIIGINPDHIGEKIGKFFSPNHLVAIYDFKKEHNIN